MIVQLQVILQILPDGIHITALGLTVEAILSVIVLRIGKLPLGDKRFVVHRIGGSAIYRQMIRDFQHIDPFAKVHFVEIKRSNLIYFESFATWGFGITEGHAKLRSGLLLKYSGERTAETAIRFFSGNAAEEGIGGTVVANFAGRRA